MALDNFIPTIWSARLLQNLEKALVYGQAGVVNRDHEGEISAQGDTVRINTLGPVAVGNYVKNANMAAPETLTDASQVLTIDYAKYFNFQVDDIDRAQQVPKIANQAMRNAAYALADTADQIIAGIMWPDVPVANTQGAVGAPVAVGFGATDTNPYVALLMAGVALDQGNVPRVGRWVILPSWFHAYLLLDQRFVATGAPAADARAVNGVVGRAAGFDIMFSPNVPNSAGTEYKVLCGTDYATGYVEQIQQVEAYRPQLRFADAVKGLHLYGAKVVYPEALALIIANMGATA